MHTCMYVYLNWDGKRKKIMEYLIDETRQRKLQSLKHTKWLKLKKEVFTAKKKKKKKKKKKNKTKNKKKKRRKKKKRKKKKKKN